MNKLLLTPTEAADALGISRSKLYQLLRDGSVSSVQIGACRRVPAAALHRYVATLDPTHASPSTEPTMAQMPS